MKKTVGIIISIILFISIISLVAILVAKGYSFTGTELRENGILNIASTPDNSEILINGESKGGTPKKIELPVGSYQISLTKSGYRSWQKEVIIKSSLAIDVNAILYPVELNLEQSTFTDIENAFFSKDGDIAIYTVENGDNSGVWVTKLEKTIFNISTDKPQKITTLDFVPSACLINKNYSIVISPNNKKALFICREETQSLFFVMSIDNGQVINLNSQLGFNPAEVNFSFDDNNLFVSDDYTLSNFSLTDGKTVLIARKSQEDKFVLTDYGTSFLSLEKTYDGKTKQLFTLNQGVTKTLGNLLSAIDLNQILTISGNKVVQDYFIYTTETKSFLFNVNHPENSIVFADSFVTPVGWSADGYSLLYIEGTTLKSLVITPLQKNELEVKSNIILENYNEGSFSVKWAPSSQKFIVYNIPEQKLYVMDEDGTNRTLLFEGNLSNLSAFTFSKNGTFLVVLVNDDNGYSNLYSIKLSV